MALKYIDIKVSTIKIKTGNFPNIVVQQICKVECLLFKMTFEKIGIKVSIIKINVSK